MAANIQKIEATLYVFEVLFSSDFNTECHGTLSISSWITAMYRIKDRIFASRHTVDPEDVCVGGLSVGPRDFTEWTLWDHFIEEDLTF